MIPVLEVTPMVPSFPPGVINIKTTGARSFKNVYNILL